MSEKMREILFRGKRIDNGEWVFGDLLRAKSYIDDIERYYIFTDAKEFPANEFIGDEEIIRKTVGQFTGLTDKNGKKIFEGDILRAKVYEMEFEDFPGIGKRKVRTGNKLDAVWTVEYKNFNASCGYFIYGKDRRFNRLLTYSVIFNNECEVIGNIHDNRELLKETPNV